MNADVYVMEFPRSGGVCQEFMYQVETKIRHGYVKTLKVDVKWRRKHRDFLNAFLYGTVIDNFHNPDSNRHI